MRADDAAESRRMREDGRRSWRNQERGPKARAQPAAGAVMWAKSPWRDRVNDAPSIGASQARSASTAPSRGVTRRATASSLKNCRYSALLGLATPLPPSRASSRACGARAWNQKWRVVTVSSAAAPEARQPWRWWSRPGRAATAAAGAAAAAAHADHTNTGRSSMCVDMMVGFRKLVWRHKYISSGAALFRFSVFFRESHT